MTNESSNRQSSDSDVSVPEVWSELKDRLDPTSTSSRYLVSKDEKGADKKIENLLDAHDIALNRPVSLKQLSPDERGDASKLNAFVEEARLTGNLQHPNIIPVHDLLPADDGSLYFTLRHVDGKRLQTILEERSIPVSLNEGMTIFTKICDAIAFAHDRGIYHTALSPVAIIIGHYGEVFVLDWGSALKSSSNDGEHVFQDLADLGTMLSAIAKHCVGTGRLPLSLEAIINRATRARGSNYASVESLREDIGRFQSGLPTMAEEASLFRQLVLLAQRHKLEAAALSVALALAGIMTVWFIQSIRLERDRALHEADVADSAHVAAIRHAEKELEYLKQLKQLVPMLKEQIDMDMKNRRFSQARQRAEVALELTKDDPDWTIWEKYGDIFQVQLQFNDAIKAYKRIPLMGTNRSRIAGKIAMCQKYNGKLAPNNSPDNVLLKLYLDMMEMKQVHEADYLITNFQKRQVAALQELRERLTKNSQQLEYLDVPLNSTTRIRTHIGAGRLTVDWSASDRHSVTNFNAIKDLPFTGLDCKKGNAINSLEALRDKPLIMLKLLDTAVSDLSPLSDLPLAQLRILSSNLSDLSPLRTVPLKTLAIGNSPYSSLAPLAEMQLTTLDISGSKVGTLSPLASQQLQSLTISRTSIKTLEGIDVSRLTSLDLSQTGFTTLNALAQATLATLNIADTPVSDLAPLTGQPLEVVNVSRTGVTSIVPLEGCPLTELIMAASAVRSLSPVAGARSLRHLDISGLPVNEIPKNTWERLERLDAQKSALVSVAALHGTPLRQVNLSDTAVADISPLINKRLHSLNIRNTKVVDISPVSESNLRILNLSGTTIRDLSPLTTVYLSSLDISNTPVTSLRGIETLPLVSLDIRNTGVTDLSLLKKSPLEEIHLDQTQYEQSIETLRVMPYLKVCFVNGKASYPKRRR